jgi:hypothetical protein
MTPFLTIAVGWLLLFVAIALFETFYHGYRSPIDWWYHVIDTDPKAGVWYYGSHDAARARKKK